jgi:hypothetical protein
MKTIALTLMILAAIPAFARQDQTPTPAQAVTFFDVLDLPARIDEPKLQKSEGDYDLKCALANRSGETLVGVRLTLMLVDSSHNNRITRVTWNEATTVPAYSIKTFEFHPTLKGETIDAAIFLGIDEVIGRDSIWRTVDADKLLRAYARGQSGLIPKVQKLQNKFDKDVPSIISREPKLPRP